MRLSSGAKRGIKVWFKTSGYLRNELGQFVTGNDKAYVDELTEANQQIAHRLQAQVVKNLHRSYVRPNVSTGRLEKATADPRNAFANAFGFGVGLPEFMDNSLAKYWRTIEEGSAETWSRGGMRGMVIHGFWGGSINGYYYQARSYSAPSPTLAPRAAGPWKGQAHGGKLKGIFAESAAKMGGSVAQGVTVTHEIAPHHDYADAVEQIDPFQIAAEDAIRILMNYLDMTLR